MNNTPLRQAAMSVYTPPFRYQHGYIFDSQHLMIADDDSVTGAVASRVRGWGKLGYLPNGAELQDEIGQIIADALNALYAKDIQAADTWVSTAAELRAITHEMDLIYDMYGGKDNKTQREELLKPLRKMCVAIGRRRQLLVTPFSI